MTQTKRILIAVGVLLFLIIAVLGIDALRRSSSSPEPEGAAVTLEAGSVPIYVDGWMTSGFGPGDQEQLEEVSFVDAEEGKTQEGWLLRDVLLLHVAEENLKADTLITVSSSSRTKSVQLTWAEVNDTANMVMFDLSGRGTLKLVSLLERLDIRDEWVQDVDKIEVLNR